MKTSHYLIPIAATVALLATSVAIAKPAFPSKVPYQGFSCATCHDGSPGLASLNSFANDFRAAGNTWTVALCEKDSDGDGASNGAELLDPDCDWAEGDALLCERIDALVSITRVFHASADGDVACITALREAFSEPP